MSTTDNTDVFYYAFVVKGDSHIDVERYRETIDWDTNAVDYVFDGERVTLMGSPIFELVELEMALLAEGWKICGDLEESSSSMMIEVERITR